jgi:hypothetical protein
MIKFHGSLHFAIRILYASIYNDILNKRIDGEPVPHPSFWRLLANKAKEEDADDDFDCITPIKKFQA